MIDILHVDLEGYDLAILEIFLSLEGFDPTILKFEWEFAATGNGPGPYDVTRFMNLLSSRGYNIHLNGLDAIALKDEPRGQCSA